MKLVKLQKSASLWRVYVEGADPERLIATLEVHHAFRHCDCFHYCWSLARVLRGDLAVASCPHVEWLCGTADWSTDVYSALAERWSRYGTMGKRELWSETDENCPICLSSEELAVARNVHCVHRFHETCIRAWCQRATRTSAHCPLCRAEWEAPPSL